MNAGSIRQGTIIGGKRVERASNGVAAFKVRKSQYSAPARCVVFADGSRAAFELGKSVDVQGWVEPLPAGNVRSGNVTTPPKVMASPRRWKGESVHGMSTRRHDMIANTNMFDTGRVNGRVGASRDGIGSSRLTGSSF